MRKFLILVIAFFCIFAFNTKFSKSEQTNSSYITDILYMSNSHLVRKDKNLFGELVSMISNIEINNPVSIMDKVFAYKIESSDVLEFSYIQNTLVDNPRVYIYSTHPLEDYSDGFSVVEASLVLQEKLNSIGIQAIVEPRSTVSYMKENNISQSYMASKVFLTDALKNNDFDLIIDLHRDQVPNSVSTKVDINGKKYAKVMFVMNKYYDENYSFATRFNNLIYSKYPMLTRGIYNKYVDTFNQDINSKVLLLELGSTQNNSEEVTNSIDILVEAIKELLNEG